MIDFIIGFLSSVSVFCLSYLGHFIYVSIRARKFRFEDLERKVGRLERDVKSLESDLEYYSNMFLTHMHDVERYMATEHERNSRPTMADVQEDAKEEYVAPLSDSESLSVNENIMLREASFDERIRQMTNMYKSVADESAGVKNLPHRIVEARDAHLPDVEQSD